MKISSSADPLGQLIQKVSGQPPSSSGLSSATQAPPSTAANPATRFDASAFAPLREGTATMARGAKGDQVKAVQEAFLSMGFWTGGPTDRQADGTYGTADGDFGGGMETAVKNFQNNRGLPETGQIDKATFAEIERLAPAKGETVWSPSYMAEDSSFVPSNLLPNGERAKVIVDLSENRLFLYDKDNDIKQVFSVAVGRVDTATGKPVTTTGYKKVDSKIGNPAWLGTQLYGEGKEDIFGPKLVGLGEYNPETGHVKNAPYEIHGTSNERSIGHEASSGCIRMLNDAVEDLYPEMKKGDVLYFKD